MVSQSSRRLLVAASGTGGHVFPAVAIAEQLSDYHIEWLGVPDRLEVQLVGDRYRLHTVRVAGFQGKPGLGTIKTLIKLIRAIGSVRKILKQGKFDGVFTTGGYISAPAILAARTLGLPVVLHESNALPGKVTRFFAPRCTAVAIGFQAAAQYLKAKTVYTGTPVRAQFLAAPESVDNLDDLGIPENVPLVVVVGGSQGAVAVNRLVRQCCPTWFDRGIWVVHLTGESDAEAQSLQHPQYIARSFYHNMAALFRRANLAISRAGAGTLTELAIARTPSILIPYPFAAEDHQAFNARVFVEAGAAEMFRQEQLIPETLQSIVLELLDSPDTLKKMATQAESLAVPDSATQVADLLRQLIERHSHR
ncbi:undecaprenyldiphospho-muramoylpentapeptide beta-N-acetylglucosaminyltransferase [Alkalinema pantanalense CENA528]|uniref:undecaprenyldiphospho-muramoylpentapeptide beta-N-acetylglucosaminyltransferase n=1 Tax=Alkalinema pantanalense TaxID=1620705 RepID=UPI003D6DC8AE